MCSPTTPSCALGWSSSERVAQDELVDMPLVFLREVAPGSAVPVFESNDATRAKRLALRVERVIRDRAKESGPQVVQALDALLEATRRVGVARFVAPGRDPVAIEAPDAPKLTLEATDEIHVRVVGVMVKGSGAAVKLRPLNGGKAQLFFTDDAAVRSQAVRLFDRTAIAHVVFRKRYGVMRPERVERLREWTEAKSPLEVLDRIHDDLERAGVEIDGDRWLAELD